MLRPIGSRGPTGALDVPRELAHAVAHRPLDPRASPAPRTPSRVDGPLDADVARAEGRLDDDVAPAEGERAPHSHAPVVPARALLDDHDVRRHAKRALEKRRRAVGDHLAAQDRLVTRAGRVECPGSARRRPPERGLGDRPARRQVEELGVRGPVDVETEAPSRTRHLYLDVAFFRMTS